MTQTVTKCADDSLRVFGYLFALLACLVVWREAVANRAAWLLGLLNVRRLRLCVCCRRLTAAGDDADESQRKKK